MRQVLFVGGCADGRREYVEAERSYVEFMEYPPAAIRAKVPEWWEDAAHKRTVYKLHPFECLWPHSHRPEDPWIGAPVGWNAFMILRQLVAGYPEER